MNKSASLSIRLMAITLLLVMMFSLISCQSLPFFNKGDDTADQNGENQTPGDENKEPDKEENKPDHKHNYLNGKCMICGADDPYADPEEHEHIFVDGKCECGQELEVPPEIATITIAEAIALCQQYPEGTADRYYIRATVKTISNANYGEMIITDETGELYVYGTYSEDGELSFSQISERPVKGDEVLLYCILSQYNGENQVKNARLISFEHKAPEINESDYVATTIQGARDAEADSLVRVSGVVARITYANGYVPSGVILVDDTSSIYVYSSDVAGQVEIGNRVEIIGKKSYWILDSETGNAGKYGYKGSNQIDDATVLSNDKANNAFDKSWITETTIKEIMDTPVTEDITNKIFKTTALVKKVDGQGFTNYYFDDIDGVTGSYVYTQCNGNDFSWLDTFDGKFCTVYIVAINAKSSASGCVWRFLPVEVIDEGYTFDLNDAAEYAVKYHALGQFLTSYTGDPILKLISSLSSEELGFEGVKLSYASSNVPVVHFSTDADGDTVMHCEATGTAIVTITATYGDITYSETLEITVKANEEISYIGVADAIKAENNSTVTVHGIVGPSLANQTGFYLIDETGAIPVRVAKTAFEGLEIGHEIIVQGTRTITKDGGGQICIDSATIVSNAYGSNSYSTESFITGKTVADICALTDSADETVSVYVVTGSISRVVGGYSTNTYVVDGDNQFMLYAGGPAQYAWLDDYTGETVTIELAICDWNAKGLKGCVLSITLADGTKLYNEYNFQ